MCTLSSGQRLLSTRKELISPPIPDDYGNSVPVCESLCVSVYWVLCCVCPDASYQFIKAQVNPLRYEEFVCQLH